MDNQVITSAAGVKADLTLKREPGSNLVTVLGTLPAKSNPRKLTLAIQEPALHAAAMLKRLLEDRGVKVSGTGAGSFAAAGTTCRRDASGAGRALSIPLGQSVKLVNKISQNLHTEMLLRTAARQDGAMGDAGGLWRILRRISMRLREFRRATWCRRTVRGLSRHDLVTPRALVALLLFAQRQPWFAAYYDSLPVAGVDGTLEDRMKNSIAKDGYTRRPVR